MTWERLVELARAEVTATIAALPQDLRKPAAALPIVYERVPGAALIEDGIEPDTLGLFVGPDFADEEQPSAVIPPQIILFLENIWEMVEEDEKEFRAEVRTTLLHELGHYLGLDEDDLDARGLL
jgi:predicted Zn-dependent protease with MMP-like domain